MPTIIRYAAIDIGTNAVRLVIKERREDGTDHHWYKLCYTRLPIRLGEDVFSNGIISTKKMEALSLAFAAFGNIMKAMEVISFRACSTSAMREAENSDVVINFIKQRTNIEIEILSGHEEARLLMENFETQDLDESRYYLFIDVGGGSTEVSLILNNERILSESFKLGTVRMLKGMNVDSEWDRIKLFCTKIKNEYSNVLAIGTGGNINKIFKESGVKPTESIHLSDIISVDKYLDSFTYEERINTLKMRPDRADVIVYASKIFINILTWAGINDMMVPKIGLSDGIILDLFERENWT